MATQNPMDVLRDLADKKLADTTTHLGKMRQEYAHANSQLERLENYEREYCQQLQSRAVDNGISIIDLISRQSFIASLNQVVIKQSQQVKVCEESVDKAMFAWRADKQRLNAFEALKQRAEIARLQQENKRDQKLMDEFAQRASRRND
jgi:flagellar FliJ protein